MKKLLLHIGLIIALVLRLPPIPAEAAQPPVLKLGQCVHTKIAGLGHRLAGNDEFSLSSGSAVWFDNKLYQVSYQEEPPIIASRSGDPVLICLVELPKDCPPGDNRGKTYRTTNLRTHKSWTLADAEHMCGGA